MNGEGVWGRGSQWRQLHIEAGRMTGSALKHRAASERSGRFKDAASLSGSAVCCSAWWDYFFHKGGSPRAGTVVGPLLGRDPVWGVVADFAKGG